MTLSVLGVGSNLDLESIVTKLLTVEHKPLDQLATRTSATNTRISAFAAVKSQLAQLQSAASDLAKTRLGALKLGLDDGTIATASVADGATAGRHKIEVTTLAAEHRLASGPFAAMTTVVGGGTLTFHFGTWDGTTFTDNASRPAKNVVVPANASLTAVRDAINSADIGVTASVVNDGSAQRLVLASDDTGAANGLRITAADGDGNNTDASGLSQLAYDPAAAAGAGRNLTQLQAAADASFIVDGLAMTRSSNDVTDAIAGVSLTLTRAAPGTPTNLTISPDDDAAAKSVQAFVKAYNDVRSMLSSATAYDAKSGSGAALFGESVLSEAVRRLRGALAARPGGLPDAMSSLAQAGVTLKSDGALAFDATKFAKARAADPQSVSTLFGAVGTGIDAALDPLLASDGGIASRVAGLNASLKRDAARQVQLQSQYDATEKRLRAQFASLDSLMSKMSSTSTYLTQQLAALPGASSK